MKNKTLYDILYDEQTWRDEKKLKELQKQIEYSPHHALCKVDALKLMVRREVFYSILVLL